MIRQSFTTQEEVELRRRWRAGQAVRCPRCGDALAARPVPQPRVVSYVRRRSWLTCPSCGRTVVADDPRDGRALV